jgi:GH15 family glucan-1,4-alpha-glucosidase
VRTLHGIPKHDRLLAPIELNVEQRTTQDKEPARIEDHGVIGNLSTVALVSTAGSIDFACFPNFDSPTVFAGLLDAERGGVFSIAPHGESLRVKQMYLPDTNVLMTRFFTEHGVGEITDFMPLTEGNHPSGFRIVRRLTSIKGEMRFCLRCAPRFDYARVAHRLTVVDSIARFVPEDGGMALRLQVNHFPVQSGSDVTCEIVLRTGESTDVVLEAESEAGGERELDHGLSATVRYWQRWAERSTYRGRWREIVTRSALTLKMLMSREYGSLVAAATFALPEVAGGERNWDYRYTWIRDAAFTVYAFMNLGYIEEATAFVDWVQTRCTEMHRDGSMQIMYGIDGRTDLKAVELTHLRGHRDSRPVTIGNNAFEQLQLDIYGALLDSVYAVNENGAKTSSDAWAKLTATVDYVCKHWDQADGGLWEFRHSKSHFLYSRLMCWVAIDRAHRLAVRRSLPAPLVRWAKVRDAIHADIINNFWDEAQSAFVQARGEKALDGSTFLLVNLHFLAPSDPRWLSTLKALEAQLVEEPFVFRYRPALVPQDDMKGIEGAFAACSFWYVEALARGGETQKARRVFERLLGSANHVGLYAEQFGATGEQLGNFPQALTHLTLIMAAVTLDAKLNAERQAA